MYNQEKVLPFQNNERKSVQVTRMFNSIAATYDKINHFMSLGVDRYWRWRLIKGVNKALNCRTQDSPLQLLDIATGTGDLLILAAKRLVLPTTAVGTGLTSARLIGIDISEGMMEIARKKAKTLARKAESSTLRNLLYSIQFVNEDATHMSFANNSFDVITTSFGIRNFENLDAALVEMYRVLKPNGVLAMLELSQPVKAPMKQLFSLYSHTILPLIGRMIANDKGAYQYLTRSIEAFPQGEEMTAIVNKAGFKEVAFTQLTCGICTLYIIKK